MAGELKQNSKTHFNRNFFSKSQTAFIVAGSQPDWRAITTPRLEEIP
jgi:hypothetical protein